MNQETRVVCRTSTLGTSHSMFGLFNRKNKSVQFNQEVADQTLWDVIEKELLAHPQISFSDLCKEALWNYLCVPASMQSQVSEGNQADWSQLQTQASQGNQINQDDLMRLQGQLAELEEHLLAQQSSGLGAIERRLEQLSYQLNQVHTPVYQPSAMAQSEPLVEQISEPEPEDFAPPAEDLDPSLSRISALLDDF